jgi:Fe-S cluster biosynthesis and repair protein YggX
MDARPPKPEDHPDWIFCSKLEKWAPPARRVPWGGKLGAAIKANVSEEAWREWLKMEVMVINELRLNFMDPKSQDVLIEHMRQFLALPE